MRSHLRWFETRSIFCLKRLRLFVLMLLGIFVIPSQHVHANDGTTLEIYSETETLISEKDNHYKLQYDFTGQLSGWTNETRNRGTWRNISGLRYIPQLSLKLPLTDDMFLDTEISFNGYLANDTEDQIEDSDLELYRLKFRFATAQSETRIGLQKINFGPALLLRPLRWFDRLDPRDPLQLTDGVYGLRMKYDALNNTNMWFWILYGNEKIKGYEIMPTTAGKPEFGGRVQIPVPRGEVAATLHTRRVDGALLNTTVFTENRYALDGRWDIGIGIWFESVLQHQRTSILPYEWQTMITIGADYTFGIGNGLHVLGEHMAAATSDQAFQWDEGLQVSALSFNYSIGLFDNLVAFCYYVWDRKDYYPYLGWQRTYDNLILRFNLFHYPQSSSGGTSFDQTALGSGYGGELMVIYNH